MDPPKTGVGGSEVESGGGGEVVRSRWGMTDTRAAG